MAVPSWKCGDRSDRIRWYKYPKNHYRKFLPRSSPLFLHTTAESAAVSPANSGMYSFHSRCKWKFDRSLPDFVGGKLSASRHSGRRKSNLPKSAASTCSSRLPEPSWSCPLLQHCPYPTVASVHLRRESRYSRNEKWFHKLQLNYSEFQNQRSFLHLGYPDALQFLHCNFSSGHRLSR